MPPRPKRSRVFFRRALLLCAALVIGIILCEVTLRVAGISYPVLYTCDPDLASQHLPGASGWWLQEGRAYVRINRDGLRDGEHRNPRPEDTFRIALLGDSYCEAFQIEVEDAFWSVMEAELNQGQTIEGRKIEVINLGVSGYATAQQLLQLRRDVWAYDPQVVLLAFTPQNDVRDNAKSLALEADPQLGGVRPFFELRNGELVLDNSFRDSAPYLARSSRYECAKATIVNKSYLLQLLKHVKQRGFRRDAPPQNGEDEPMLDHARQSAEIYSAPKTEDWTMAWQMTERMIQQMHKETRRHDARFCVVVLSTCLQAYPDARVRRKFMDEQGIDDLSYPNRRIVELGERSGFPVADVAPFLRAHAEKHQEFLHGAYNTPKGVGHYSVEGHRIVGEYLAEWLRKELQTDDSISHGTAPAKPGT